jgi:hypothetical protein
MRLFRLLILGIISILVASCNNSVATSTPDEGVISNNVYENKYFSFSLPLPDGWAVADSKAKESMRQTSKELVAKDDPALEAAMNKAEQTTYQLLTLSEKPIGTSPSPNPSIIVGAEKVSQVPSIKNGNDYISQATKILIQQLPYEPLEKIYEYDLAGKPFYRTDLVLNTQVGRLNQSYISMVSKEYALTFILTGQTKEEISRLENIIKAGNFESIPTEVVKSEQKPVSSVQGIIGMVLIVGGGLVALIAGWNKRRKAKTDEDNVENNPVEV